MQNVGTPFCHQCVQKAYQHPLTLPGATVWSVVIFDIDQNRGFVTSAMAKVMFSSLSVALSVCLSACLSVCLSVSNITGKRLNGFSWFFQGKWDLIQGTIENIFRMFYYIPSTQAFLSTFRRNPWLLTALQKNGWTDFHEIFTKGRFDTRSNLEHFRVVTVNPLNPGSIYLFPGFVLFVILWKMG